MFSSEMLVRDGKSRRVAPRSPAAFDTDLRQGAGGSRSPCRIVDVSSGGARLLVYQDLATDAAIRVALPGRGLVDAQIVWANGREAGCRFDQPIDDATISALIASGTGRSPGS